MTGWDGRATNRTVKHVLDEDASSDTGYGHAAVYQQERFKVDKLE